MPFITPDRVFQNYYEITPEVLSERGIRALILDIDNTLIPYEETEARAEFTPWLTALRENGITVALVSNNHKPRMQIFNAPFGLVGYANSLKPLPHNLFRAAKKMGVKRKECAMVGDQLLTDMFAARFAGMRSFIVPPIRDKQNAVTRFKRRLEKPLMNRYMKRNGTT